MSTPGNGFFNVKAPPFLAKGDGKLHPLSEQFSTPEDAKEVYPCATKLDESIDWAAIQTAIDVAGAINGQVCVPPGTYVMNKGLTIKGAITLRGVRFGSILDFSNLASNPADQFGSRAISIGSADQPIGLRGLVIEGFRIRGVTPPLASIALQSTAISIFGDDVHGGVNNCVFRDLEIGSFLCGLNARINWTNQFQNVFFDSCLVPAILQETLNTDFLCCSFSNSQAGVVLYQCQAVNFSSCLFQNIHDDYNGPLPLKQSNKWVSGVALTMDNGNSVTVVNPYFEDIRGYIGMVSNSSRLMILGGCQSDNCPKFSVRLSGTTSASDVAVSLFPSSCFVSA